jgi:predicted DsbA family dithiol-disulfide isomerase
MRETRHCIGTISFAPSATSVSIETPSSTVLAQEARDAGLPLHWPLRLPNTRVALAAAEWTRRFQPHAFPRLHRDLFAAHFALGENLGDPAVVDRHARDVGIDITAMHAALRDGSALDAVTHAEALGREHGVSGTPAWFVNGQLIMGLQPAENFERM